jgi:hypothetical protein
MEAQPRARDDQEGFGASRLRGDIIALPLLRGSLSFTRSSCSRNRISSVSSRQWRFLRPGLSSLS